MKALHTCIRVKDLDQSVAFTQAPSLLRKTIVKIFQIVNLLLFIWL